MNTPVPTADRVSTLAYTFMGVELIISGIITIAMHYGIASNPQAAFVVYSATFTPRILYPVWGGALVSIKNDVFNFLIDIILIPIQNILKVPYLMSNICNILSITFTCWCINSIRGNSIS